MQHPDDGLIEEYLDSELASPERAELEEHLAGCAACRERVETSRRFLAEASQLIEDLGDPGAVPLPDVVPATGHVSARPARPARPARLPVRELAWAATLVIAAGLGYASGTWRARSMLAPEAAQQQAATAESAQALSPDRLPASPPAEPSSHPAIQPSEERELNAPAAAEPLERRVGEAGQRADALRDEDRDLLREDVPSGRRAVVPSDGRAVAPSEFAKSAAAPANAAPQAVQPAGRPAVTLDDAVRLLCGSIRLIDGMEVEKVEIEEPAVVVLTYRDAAGNPIELRQSRPLALARQAVAAESRRLAEAAAGADRAERSRAAAPAPAPAPAAGALDAAVTKDKLEDGGLGWTDSAGFRLLLRADADADSLRKLRTRIR